MPSEPVKKVEISGLPDFTRILREDLIGKTLYVTLTDGREINVELFERTPGRIAVRTTHGVMTLHPRAANLVDVAVEL